MLKTIDKNIVKVRFLKSHKTYNKNAVIQKRMAKKLIKKVIRINGLYFESILELGSGPGLLTNRILKELQIKNFIINDLSDEYKKIVDKYKTKYKSINFSYLCKDIEELTHEFNNKNLIISNAVIQWLDNFPNLLRNLNANVNDNTLIAFTTFGVNNFTEIKKISGKSLKYLDREILLENLEKYFDILFFQEESNKLKFNNIIDILRHLKMTGVTGTNREHWTKSKIRDFEKEYNAFKMDDGNFPLTYHPVYFILKRK